MTKPTAPSPIIAGAPHSFFDRTKHEHAAASEDAWERILGFMGVQGPPEDGE